MENRRKIPPLGLVLIALAAACIVVALGAVESIGAGDISTTGFADKFGFLVLISLFVERATAVLISISGKDELVEAKNKLFAANLRLKEARARAERQPSQVGDPSEVQDSEVNTHIDEVVRFKLELDKKYQEEDFKASIPSVALGVLVAVAGVGAMGLFLDANVFTCEAADEICKKVTGACTEAKALCQALNSGELSAKIFRVVDIVLTGLLIGGGSVGIRGIWRAIEDWRTQTV